jgi:DNA repair protein RecN (Recombination protein N)
MLNQIHIRDLATIEDQHLDLSNGTTMITGESGAGKSIFIEAIELALGARGSANLIRPGKERADISLCFEIPNLPKVIEWLKEADLYQDNDVCIIRRVLTNDGRSRSYINGLPATLQLVRELAELLFHLHGQCEQQVLLNIDNQREILDRYAKHIPLANNVKQLATEWRSLDRDIQSLNQKNHERDERRAYLRFQLEEFSVLQLQPNEWETLEIEHHKLTHTEEFLQNLQNSLAYLTNDDRSALSLLNDMRKSLEMMPAFETKAGEWLATLDSSLIPLNDLEAELTSYSETIELDPQRLQFVEHRISQIFDLARKHRTTPQALLDLQEQLTTELAILESSNTELARLEEQQKKVTIAYQELAAELSKNRRNAAINLAKEITQTIRSLSLPHSEFIISIEKEPTPFSLHGLEKITFIIKTNPDQLPQPIAKVISGGELSRLSLAIHLALAHQTTTPTLIFDEIDTGVGGATAEKIGKLLKKLGNAYQVFCVTHQAQVAACAHHHLLVEKYFLEAKTHTRLRFLSVAERTNEIARMLGGEKITQKTLDHAREILTLA